MNIGELRDLVIIIVSIIGTIAIVMMTILLFVCSSRIKKITDKLEVTLGKIDGMTSRLQEISAYASDNIAKPLINLASLVQGASQGLHVFKRIFGKRR